jgi:hypothetical protein
MVNWRDNMRGKFREDPNPMYPISYWYDILETTTHIAKNVLFYFFLP